MNSKKLKRNELESFLFALKLKIATIEDFAYYITIISKRNYFYVYYYLSLIHRFFINNYHLWLRNYALEVFNHSKQSIIKLDELYIETLTQEAIVDAIQNEYLLNKANEKLTLSIQYSIDLIINNNVSEVNIDLLFYLFIISLIQKDKEYYVYICKSILRYINNDYNIAKMIELTNVVNRIETKTILEMFNMNNQTEEKKRFVPFIKLYEFLRITINEENLIERIDNLMIEFKVAKFNSLKNSYFIPILLEYFDKIEFSNKQIYFEIFVKFINNNKSSIYNESNKIVLVKWLITKIQNLNLDIHYGHEILFKSIKETFMNLIMDDNKDYFIYEIFPCFIIKLTNALKEIELIKFYNIFKKEIANISYYKNVSIQLQYALFYFKLISKRTKTRFISLIKTDETDNNDINIYHLYTLFIKFSSIFTQNNIYTVQDVITILQNEVINKNNIIQYKNVNYLKFIENPSSYLTKQIKKESAIALLKFLNENISKIKESSLFSNLIITSNNCIYKFKGVLTIDKHKQKKIFIFDNYSQTWYSLNDSSWKNEFLIETDLRSLTMIYVIKMNFKTKKEPLPILKTIHPLQDGKTKDLYWKTFINIIGINASLLKEINYCIKWFSLDNNQMIINFWRLLIANKTLQNKHEIIKEIVKVFKKSKPISNNNFQISHNEDAIMKPYFFFENIIYFLSLNKELPSDFDNDEFISNIIYYLKNINVIKGISCELGFCITLILFWKKLNTKDNSPLIEELNIINRYNQDLIYLLCLICSQKEKNNYYTNIISFWNKQKMILLDDYKFRFLSEIIIFVCQGKNDNETIIKEFTYLIQHNKTFVNMVISNTNPFYQYIIIIYKFIIKKYQSESTLYYELLHICFNLPKQSIELTSLQQIILTEYVDMLFTLKKINQLIMTFEYISLFIFDYEDIMQFFIENLFKLKNRQDFSLKQITPLLDILFQTALKNSMKPELIYSIKFFYIYSKISRTKLKIENISTIQFINEQDSYIVIHHIFLTINKQIRNILSNNHMNLTDLLSNAIEDIQSSNSNKNFINELSYIESKFPCQIFIAYKLIIIDDKETLIKVYPKENVESKCIPLIIYYSYKNAKQFPYNMISYLNREFLLKGIVLKFKNLKRKSVFIRNYYNLFWYSVFEDQWNRDKKTVEIINNLIKKGDIDSMIGVYFLKRNKEENEFKGFHVEVENIYSKYFEVLIMKENKWIKKNIDNNVIRNNTWINYFLEYEQNIKKIENLDLNHY